jgi:hypothetical protein
VVWTGADSLIISILAGPSLDSKAAAVDLAKAVLEQGGNEFPTIEKKGHEQPSFSGSRIASEAETEVGAIHPGVDFHGTQKSPLTAASVSMSM